ncbi:MAG: ABC transporter substrate-binding protein, partial [Actinomycetota bacterium]
MTNTSREWKTATSRVVIAAALVLAFAACGSDESGFDVDSTAPASEAADEPVATDDAGASRETSDDAEVSDAMTDVDGESVVGSEPASESASASAISFVDHVGSTIELDAPPERVVTLSSFQDLDSLLAVGIVPIAVFGFADPLPYQLDAIDALGAEPPQVFPYGDPPIEALAALEPDVFFTYQNFETAFEGLEGIGAPLVVIPDGGFSEQVRIAALLAGDERRGDEAVADLQASIDAFDAGDAPPTLSVASPDATAGAIFALHAGTVAADLLGELGLEIVGPQAPDDFNFGIEISLETMGEELTGDVLAVTQYSSEDLAQIITDDP